VPEAVGDLVTIPPFNVRVRLLEAETTNVFVASIVSELAVPLTSRSIVDDGEIPLPREKLSFAVGVTPATQFDESLHAFPAPAPLHAIWLLATE
jgi:hypothetical protein